MACSILCSFSPAATAKIAAAFAEQRSSRGVDIAMGKNKKSKYVALQRAVSVHVKPGDLKNRQETLNNIGFFESWQYCAVLTVKGGRSQASIKD